MAIPLIGAHVSAEGGLVNAFDRAETIGATVMQIFGASPRMYRANPVKDEAVTAFQDRWQKSSVEAVYLHAAYVVNLATPEPESLEKSVKNLAAHLSIADQIGASGLIFHVGSGKEMPKAEALAQAIAAMKEVLRRSSGSARLMIENSAGGGQKIGSTIDEIAAMISGVDSPRMAACFDTAHAFEAGVIEHYTPETVAALCDEWQEKIGLDRLLAMHVNDSKTPFDSHHDRHENIGEGFIGLSGFQALAAETRLHHVAWMLEVPGFDDNGPDKQNIDILRGCFKK